MTNPQALTRAERDKLAVVAGGELIADFEAPCRRLATCLAMLDKETA